MPAIPPDHLAHRGAGSALATEVLIPVAPATAVLLGLCYTGSASQSSINVLLCWSVLLSALIATIQRRMRYGRLQIGHPALAAIFLLEAIYFFISLRFTVSPAISFTTVWVLGALPAGFLLGNLLSGEPGFWDRASVPLRGLAGGVFGMGIFQYVLLRDRPIGPFLDWNLLAAFANLFFFPEYCRLIDQAKKSDWRTALTGSSGILALLALSCLAMTTSRGGYLCWAVGFIAVSTSLIRRNRQYIRVALACLVVFGTLTVVVSATQQADQSIGARFASTDKDQSALERMMMVRSTLEMYRDGPWFGTGLGSYKARYPAYRDAKATTSSGDLAHNDYLQYLVEGGPILAGLLLLNALCVGILMLSAIRSRKTDNGTALSADYENIGLSVAVTCVYLHAAVNFIFYSLPMSLLLGLFIGRLAQSSQTSRSFDLIRFIPVRAIYLLLASLWLACIVTVGGESSFVRITSGECDSRFCVELSKDPHFLTQLAILLEVVDPFWPEPRSYLVHKYYEAAVAERSQGLSGAAAIAALREELFDQIRRYPVHPLAYRQLAVLFEEFPETRRAVPNDIPDSPRELYRIALSKDPLEIESRLRLASLMKKAGEDAAAFNLVAIDGMKWWDLATFGDQARLQLVRAALPWAIERGQCDLALNLASKTLTLSPGDELAEKTLRMVPNRSAQQSNCGLENAEFHDKAKVGNG